MANTVQHPSTTDIQDTEMYRYYMELKARWKKLAHMDSDIFFLTKSPMSVKDVLQSLVDDGMVDTERVGTSNYYWAFPSKALHARKRKLNDLEKQIAEGEQKKTALELAVKKAKMGRQDTTIDSILNLQDNRAALLKELQELREQRNLIKAEVEKYKECDPDVVEEIRQSNKTAKEAANRWTDNVFAIKSWAKRKFAFEESKIDKTFGIPEDFDYID
ncbi:MND1 protein, partial [Polypterus senegalus]